MTCQARQASVSRGSVSFWVRNRDPGCRKQNRTRFVLRPTFSCCAVEITQNRGGLWSMPFSQIRYILLAHRSSEKTDTGQRIDTPLNPLPTSKDLQKSFTVGFGKTGAPATAAGEKESDLQTRSTDEGRPRSDAITISGHSAGPNTASKLCQTKTAKSAGMH